MYILLKEEHLINTYYPSLLHLGALQVHSDLLEEDTSTPEVESQASLPEDSATNSAATTTSESESSSNPEEEEEESTSTTSESTSTSQESEDEDSQSSEEATATPGAADSDSDESESDEADEAGPDVTTDMPVITAK